MALGAHVYSCGESASWGGKLGECPVAAPVKSATGKMKHGQNC
ncbi:hypothetical protein HMPREF0293_1205 [Corynebacterium glucuronolyticum ATCC 51866]|uniref:Uncharacterized protein n=1 Tax=Corynebacterium glucuronolyticum ATCC 51866 TaxID=548478 RepID=A0ABM9XQ45_9CORY|nr:hypothetical protein HMPREF0293_1205 [Corynebacterium glucuronolyticum ATCC 51866]